ncbi:MAG: M24 family metallopeptidase [Gammaproteobacteria bacterium]|jgi:Xaa-Pro aminopeptidase|nr:MAG: M24 family metallopeptidase [Gammaproteobacteria bacterium]
MNVKEFPRRRKRLMDMMGDETIAIIPTASVHIRNRDVEFPFRPDSDFYYLTGYPEPVAVAVLVPGRSNGEYVLFCRERDAKMETWHGRRAGLEGACDHYGADDAFPIEDLDDILPGLLEGRERIFYTMGNDQAFDQRVVRWVKQVRDLARSGVHAPDEFVSLTHLLHEMRLFKSREEIAAIRQAIRIAGKGHLRAMQVCQPGMTEYQIEAELVHEFMRQGARSPAYPPIVGAGANSCILHYTENTSELQAGDILLIDAGAEYDCYASDITRSFPISGEFSREQALIYELVLAAQKAAIAQVKPGRHWNDPHEAAIAVITDGLIELGILRGTRKKLLSDEAFTRYYMHRTGHWLGMDVHDVGEYKLDGEWRTLEPGMILTIEPGLYFQPARGLAKKWWNIGIRIEDDVLVTRTGHDVLSRHIPKELAEIERLMA